MAQLEWMWHSLTRGSFVHLPWPDCRRRLVILSSCSPGCRKAHLSKQISASKTKYARHIHIIKLCGWPKVMKKLRIHFTCRQYHSIYFNISLSVIFCRDIVPTQWFYLNNNFILNFAFVLAIPFFGRIVYNTYIGKSIIPVMKKRLIYVTSI